MDDPFHIQDPPSCLTVDANLEYVRVRLYDGTYVMSDIIVYMYRRVTNNIRHLECEH